MILLFTNIIFLNFLIAEAGNSYARVKERLFEFNLKESALLIDEAEHMIPGCIRNSTLYPKYIIHREVDDWVKLL